jgi:hypothetical protein
MACRTFPPVDARQFESWNSIPTRNLTLSPVVSKP